MIFPYDEKKKKKKSRISFVTAYDIIVLSFIIIYI